MAGLYHDKCLWPAQVPLRHKSYAFSYKLVFARMSSVWLDFQPSAVMFADHHYSQVIVSDIGILFWLGGIAYSIWNYGFVNVFTLYLVPYLWYV